MHCWFPPITLPLPSTIKVLGSMKGIELVGEVLMFFAGPVIFQRSSSSPVEEVSSTSSKRV